MLNLKLKVAEQRNDLHFGPIFSSLNKTHIIWILNNFSNFIIFFHWIIIFCKFFFIEFDFFSSFSHLFFKFHVNEEIDREKIYRWRKKEMKEKQTISQSTNRVICVGWINNRRKDTQKEGENIFELIGKCLCLREISNIGWQTNHGGEMKSTSNYWPMS